MTASLINVPAELPEAEQRLCLEGITWQQYDALVTLFLDQFPALRMTYLEGSLELMTTSPEHERLKKIIARLIEALLSSLTELAKLKQLKLIVRP